MGEIITLVDSNDNVVGAGEKLEVHKNNVLHRAFSIFIFDKNGRLILQQRAFEKYHCGGEWSNTCCGHPRPTETLEFAAHRRLAEEMGFDCELTELFVFHYQTTFPNGLSENEIDHVFVGRYDGEVNPNPDEVAVVDFHSLDYLQKDIENNENKYTYWFRYILRDHSLFNMLKNYL